MAKSSDAKPSKALARFSKRSWSLWHFYRVTEGLLEVYSAAHTARRPTKGDDWLLKRLDAIETSWAVEHKRSDLNARFQLLFDVWTMRYVDYFNMFLAELFLEIAQKRPEVLASFEKEVEVSLILDSTSLQEVKQQIAIRKAIGLSYGGFNDVRKFFSEHLGVKPELDGNDVRLVKELIAVRNLLIHHDGFITDKFLLETQWSGMRRGQRIQISEALLERHDEATQRVAEALSATAVEKFAL